MNYQSKRNSRFILDTARPGDDSQILEILEENDFNGNIQLTYTRRPSPHLSFQKEGEKVIIIVVRDTKSGRIAGFGGCALNRLYIDGKPATAGYLFTLRGQAEYRRKTLALHRAYGYLFDLLKEYKISCFFTTILEENRQARRLLEKKRSFMPAYNYRGLYNVYTVKTGRKPGPSKRYLFKRAREEELPLLADFLQNEGKKKQFFPYIDEAFLKDEKNRLIRENFYLVIDRENQGAICGACCCWDQRDYKQYILKGYKGILNLVYPVRSLLPLFGYPALPETDSVINFFTLSFWAVKDDDPDLFRFLLDSVSASCREYSYFLTGIHQTDRLNRVIKKIPHFLYTSCLYQVDPDHTDSTGTAGQQIYLECGRL